MHPEDGAILHVPPADLVAVREVQVHALGVQCAAGLHQTAVVLLWHVGGEPELVVVVLQVSKA